LREALTGLSHATLEDSWNYIVTAANRVHMAQHGNYSDADAVNESARYTLNFIEIALSYLSGGEIAKAKSAYLAHAPQDLFKIGHSLVLRLRRDFQKLSKHPAFSLAQSSMARLDSPLREVVSGVMQVEPLFFTGLTDPKRIDFRTFENVREVAQASAAIAEAAFRLAFLKAMGFEEQGVAAKDAPAFGLLLGTHFAHAILAKGSFDALSTEEFQTFFARLEGSESGRKLRDADKKKCLELAQQKAESLVGLVGVRTVQDAHNRAVNYAQIVLGRIESELSQIKDKTPDPKFIHSLLIK